MKQGLQRSKLTLLHQMHSGQRTIGELQPPREPGELGEAPTLARRGSWKPWLLLPNTRSVIQQRSGRGIPSDKRKQILQVVALL